MALVWRSLLPIVLGLIFRPRPGDPVAERLGMHQGRATATVASGKARTKTKDSCDDAEGKAFVAAFIQHNVDVLTHDSGDLPHHASPARLTPRLPGDGTRGRSRIGGAPMLAEGMPWPPVNDAFRDTIVLSCRSILSVDLGMVPKGSLRWEATWFEDTGIHKDKFWDL